jgi:hypothetical protein
MFKRVIKIKIVYYLICVLVSVVSRLLFSETQIECFYEILLFQDFKLVWPYYYISWSEIYNLHTLFNSDDIITFYDNLYSSTNDNLSGNTSDNLYSSTSDNLSGNTNDNLSSSTSDNLSGNTNDNLSSSNNFFNNDNDNSSGSKGSLNQPNLKVDLKKISQFFSKKELKLLEKRYNLGNSYNFYSDETFNQTIDLLSNKSFIHRRYLERYIIEKSSDNASTEIAFVALITLFCLIDIAVRGTDITDTPDNFPNNITDVINQSETDVINQSETGSINQSETGSINQSETGSINQSETGSGYFSEDPILRENQILDRLYKDPDFRLKVDIERLTRLAISGEGKNLDSATLDKIFPGFDPVVRDIYLDPNFHTFSGSQSTLDSTPNVNPLQPSSLPNARKIGDEIDEFFEDID